MKEKQSVSIYRHRKTGDFRLQPFGRLPNGSSQPFGELEDLANATSNAELTAAMLENLAKNDHQIYEESSVPKLSREEQKQIFKEQQLISVYRSGAECRIIPFRRMGNSFGSIDDMIQVVSMDEFARSGGEIVRRLFDEIS